MNRNLLAGTVFALSLLFGSTAVFAGKYRFTFVTHGGPGNPFWNVVIKGMEDAGKRYDVDVQWLSNPTFSIEDMPDFLEDAMASGADGIGITCPDPEAIRESVERARQAGIPNRERHNCGANSADQAHPLGKARYRLVERPTARSRVSRPITLLDNATR